jgi:hypothetical protein
MRGHEQLNKGNAVFTNAIHTHGNKHTKEKHKKPRKISTTPP